MKLLKQKACPWAFCRGNGVEDTHKTMTVMGEALMEGFSDRGSIPLSSILWKCRGVAQFGRAPRSGRGSRKFESCHLDR